MKLLTLLKDIKFTPAQKALFDNLDFKTVNDIFTYYPKRYNFILPTKLEEGRVVIEAEITSEPKLVFYQGKKNRINFDATYQNQLFKVVIFNRHFIYKQLLTTNKLTLIGKYDSNTNTLAVSDLRFNPLKEIEGIYPVYKLPDNYTNANYLKLLKKIFKEYYADINNIIPNSLINEYSLFTRQESLKEIHFPSNNFNLKKAKQTLIYEEFFLFAIKTLLTLARRVKDESNVKAIEKNDLNYLVDTLKYDLTKDQKQALNDIYVDLGSNKLMNRLILADVGSGKTLVALISSYMVYMAGYQSALMVPTTILAIQHYESALETFKEVEFNVALLTSQTPDKEKIVILNDLKKGKIDLLIGTHAIFQKDVIFKNLGLVIYDEQQRFGVEQRALLKAKGEHVEQLMLSATPIPRTLAQLAFFALDVTYMKETLPFKKPIKSYYFQSKSLKPFYEEMIKLLNQNQQIYIVTPLIEESEAIDTRNAQDIYQNIKKHFQDKYRVGLVHGKLDSKEKEKIISDFAQHELDILVTTSLIEVGISISNANCMIIYDAHRFGLSQLHQLRGRVGRGHQQGYCVFLSDSQEENTIKKLDYLAQNNDGFALAEYDLLMRGPGDVLGNKQAGMPNFIFDPIKNKKIFDKAYSDANDFIKDQEEFKKWYVKNKEFLKN